MISWLHCVTAWLTAVASPSTPAVYPPVPPIINSHTLWYRDHACMDSSLSALNILDNISALS